jgi:hypothetical protein
MKSLLPVTFLALLLATALFTPSAKADSVPLLTVAGTGGGATPFGNSDDDPQYVGMSFILGRSFKNVAIRVDDAFIVGPGQAIAYLTNGIDPSATSANVIAIAPFSGPLLPSESDTFFGNLNLTPGTYFFMLTMQGMQQAGWLAPNSFTVTTAPGVSFFGDMITTGSFPDGCPGGPYSPPTGCGPVDLVFPSQWSFGDSGFPLQITGTPVPEPATLLLLIPRLTGLSGFQTEEGYNLASGEAQENGRSDPDMNNCRMVLRIPGSGRTD